MRLVFALGIQKYFLDRIPNMVYQDQLNLMKSLLQETENYFIFINYAFTPEEYVKFGMGLPKCIIGEPDTQIPFEIRERSGKGNMSIIHRRHKDPFNGSNPPLDEVIKDVVENMNRIHEDEEDPAKFERIDVFSITQDPIDVSLLLTGLDEMGVTKKFPAHVF